MKSSNLATAMSKPFAIFDMDGTLVESMGFWRGLSREYLMARGISRDVEAMVKWAKGKPMFQTAAKMIEEFDLTETVESVSAEMNAIMINHYRKDVFLKPGVREYLERLKARGTHLCVASATTLPLIDSCLTRLGVREYFDFLVSCEAVGAGKDNPAIYFEAARRLGSRPEETAVYEDTLYAVRTSLAAGFHTVAVWDAEEKQNWPILQELCQDTVEDWTAV